MTGFVVQGHILLKESTSTATKKKKQLENQRNASARKKKSTTVQYANEWKKTDHSQCSMQIINDLMTF